MRVKKYLALTLAAALATCLLTACPWDIEDDAASSPSSAPSASRPNDDSPSSSSTPSSSSSSSSSSSTPDEPKINVDTNGALQLPEGTTSLSADDIKDIKNDIKTVNLTNIDVEQDTFAGCPNLTTVNITGGTLNSGDEIDGPFNNCNNLTTVTLDGVTINGHSTFAWCGNLRTVNLNNVDIENATSTFYHCSKLTTVTGAENLSTIPQSMFAVCTSLRYIDISKAKSIGNNAFGGFNSLEFIRVGAGLQKIGVRAFKAVASDGALVPMELTVHYTGSEGEESEKLKDLFEDDSICGVTSNGYPKFEYNCDNDCWNKIVSQSQTGGPDAGNALAQYLLDLRL